LLTIVKYNEVMDYSFLTVEEVASALKVCDMTIYRHIKAGRLKAYKVGKFFRIDKKEFDNFLTKTKTEE